jgi:hypothetical protein
MNAWMAAGRVVFEWRDLGGLQGRQKIGLAKTFNDFGLDLMLCDVDVVWIKDPTHFFNLYPEADILTSRSAHYHNSLSISPLVWVPAALCCSARL